MHSLLLVFALLFASGNIKGPEDMDKSFQSLKEAQAKNDAVQVKTLALETYAIAQELAAAPAPADATEKDAWKQQVEYAKSVETQTEYAVYVTAIEAAPATTLDLFTTLQQLNAASKYVDMGAGRYFYALSQAGAAAKIPAAAEKILARFPNNDEALIVLADAAMTKKQNDRAIALADRLVNAMKRPKPEGETAADWERRKTTGLGRGYWIAGVLRAEKEQYFKANEDLRASLPFIKGNEAMAGPALFYLGLVNYQLGKQTLNRAQVREAAKFSEEAAAIKGPYADQAYHNALVMKAEAERLR